MTIRIGSNIASLNAQRRLGEADSALSKTFERLSSGQRINRASDDAAGLAIADDLKAKGRIYTQGIRNGNDGISLLNIADSAIDALSGIVTRIRELSEQAANGTYSNKQREALDNEAQELSKEFTRITQTTTFNGIKLFDGSLGQGVRLQLGVGTSESINASIGGAIGTGQFADLISYTSEANFSYDLELADLNNDGIEDLVTVGASAGTGKISIRMGMGNGQFTNAVQHTGHDIFTLNVELKDLNQDGNLDLISVGSMSTSGGKVQVRLGAGDGSFGQAVYYSAQSSATYAVSVEDINNDGKLDLISAGLGNSLGEVSVRLGNGDGSFSDSAIYTSDEYFNLDLKVGDLNGDGNLDLISVGQGNYGSTPNIRFGRGDGSFGELVIISSGLVRSNAVSLGDVNGDGRLDIVTSGYDYYTGKTSVLLGTGSGNFAGPVIYSAEAQESIDVQLYDINNDSFLDLVTAGKGGGVAYNTIRLGQGNGQFGSLAVLSFSGTEAAAIKFADINSDGVYDLVSAGRDASSGRVVTRLNITKDGLGALLDFSLKTKAGSLQAMRILDDTLENLAKQRGTIGASQSRVNIAISNLQTAKENFAAAESRIRDADVASEAANLVRTQILQQAAASVLSQANQAPQLALTLLR